MTRNELKDIIKECLLDMKYDSNNDITLEDVVTEAASITSYNDVFESYIEESNNFNNIVLNVVNEAVDKETINRLKEKAKKAIKAIIEKIKKFITFIKEKVKALINKIKEKVSKIKKEKFFNIDHDELKEKTKEINKKKELDKFLKQEINTYNMKLLYSDLEEFYNNIMDNCNDIISYNKIETTYHISDYPDNKVLITYNINHFLLDQKSNLNYIEDIQSHIEKSINPTIDVLQKILKTLNDEYKNIRKNENTLDLSDKEISELLKNEKYIYSIEIVGINNIISDLSTLITKTEQYCEKYLTQCKQIKSNLILFGINADDVID